MFYAHFVLAKKGPLARIWLAAHWDKKLTKAHVFETNIESSVEGILQPKVKMALRTSGHLLLGIVRIYSRKAKYLLADCNEAFIKIKIAFRPGVVDLPEGNREAAVAAITLPEVFHDFDTAMPDITIDMDAQVSLNQSRAEDITLKEDYGNLSLIADDGFDDLGFDEPDAAREVTSIEDFDHASLLLGGENPVEPRQDEPTSANTSTNIITGKPSMSLDAPLKDDGFGGTIGEGLLDGETGALFEPAGLFDDAPLGPVPEPTTVEEPSTSQAIDPQPPEKPAEIQHPEEDSDDDMYDMAPGSIGAPSPPSSPESPGPPEPQTTLEPNPVEGPSETGMELRSRDPPEQPMPPPSPVHHSVEPDMPPPPVPSLPTLEHTTLINNDAESFALAPLDATIVHGTERTVKTKRKRKLIVDEVKSISGEEMKTQLSDTTDIVATLDLAPPTKRLMHWKETGGVEKLFALPGHQILSKTLSKGYARHLTTRSVDNEDFFKDDSDFKEDSEVELPREEEPSVVDLISNSEAEVARENERSGPRTSKRRRLSDRLVSSDMLPLDTFQFDNSRPSLHHDAALSHPSLDVSGYYEPQHPLYPPVNDHSQQSMIAPQDHMMPQMNYNELQQLPNIPHIIDSMGQGPSLEPVLPPDVLPPSHIQPSDMAHSLLDTFQESAPNNRCLEDSTTQPFSSSDKNNLMVDNEATQICPENHFTENQAPTEAAAASLEPSLDPVNQAPPPSVAQPETQIVSDRIPDTNDLFDSLIGDLQQQQPSELQNHIPENGLDEDKNAQQQNNEYPLSDDDDYGAPASVGPIIPDEQMADETYEQFEERILTKRTTHLLHCIHNRLESHQQVSFADLVRNNKRKQVAQKFYTFLVLKKQQAVELDQDRTYGDLIITKGPKYNLAYNGN